MRSGPWRATGCAVALLALGTLGFATPAAAQLGGGFQGVQGAPAIGGKEPEPAFGRQALPAPSALPGAQSRSGAAPATLPAQMMDPTEALFDAVNRGDLAAARDAISRGADMQGHNVLGMTPIQLAVDLGRNDITFLLLSNGAGRSGGATASATPASAASARAMLTAAPAPAKPAKAAARRAEQPARAATPGSQLPRLFADDGGAPVPSAGFLGFGPQR